MGLHFLQHFQARSEVLAKYTQRRSVQGAMPESIWTIALGSEWNFLEKVIADEGILIAVWSPESIYGLPRF